jgi:hypothetical protein
MKLLKEAPRRRSAVEKEVRKATGWGRWARFLTALLRALSVAAA